MRRVRVVTQNPTFCLWVELGGMRRLAFRPAWCWVVCGVWCSAPDVVWYGVVGMPPGFLRLMIRFTHTTQPTPVLRTSARSLPYPPILPSQRGHLYFADKGTFLLCIDILLCKLLVCQFDSSRNASVAPQDMPNWHFCLGNYLDFFQNVASGEWCKGLADPVHAV